jgi:vacuolar-type H+-ATPase subunit I/STV1
MPDETTQPEPEANAEDTTEPVATTETNTEIRDPEALLRTLATLRDERKAAEKELKELRAQVKQTEDAQLSETERLARQLEEVAAERDRLMLDAQTTQATSSLTAAATAAGAIRPDAVAQLAIGEWNDDTDAAALIGTVRERFPELFRSSPGPADAGQGKGSTPPNSMTDLIRRAAGK